jgi:hypothetical protein
MGERRPGSRQDFVEARFIEGFRQIIDGGNRQCLAPDDILRGDEYEVRPQPQAHGPQGVQAQGTGPRHVEKHQLGRMGADGFETVSLRAVFSYHVDVGVAIEQ